MSPSAFCSVLVALVERLCGRGMGEEGSSKRRLGCPWSCGNRLVFGPAEGSTEAVEEATFLLSWTLGSPGELT